MLTKYQLAKDPEWADIPRDRSEPIYLRPRMDPSIRSLFHNHCMDLPDSWISSSASSTYVILRNNLHPSHCHYLPAHCSTHSQQPFCFLWAQYTFLNLAAYLDILRRMSLIISTYDLLIVWSLSDVAAHCQNINKIKISHSELNNNSWSILPCWKYTIKCPLWYPPLRMSFCGAFFCSAGHCQHWKCFSELNKNSWRMPHSTKERWRGCLSYALITLQFCGAFPYDVGHYQ